MDTSDDDSDKVKKSKHLEKTPASLSCLCHLCFHRFYDSSTYRRHLGRKHPSHYWDKCSKCHEIIYGTSAKLSTSVKRQRYTRQAKQMSSKTKIINFDNEHNLEGDRRIKPCFVSLAKSVIPDHFLPTLVRRPMALGTKFKRFNKFQCSSCPKVYSSQPHLKRHFQTFHKRMRFSSSGKGKKYPCCDCSRTFNSTQSLWYHYNSSHAGLRFKCHLCPTLFSLHRVQGCSPSLST